MSCAKYRRAVASRRALILLDRLFGTFREGEGIVVGQDERRRLSIGEQTLFPFRPLIERVKARRAPDGSSVTVG